MDKKNMIKKKGWTHTRHGLLQEINGWLTNYLMARHLNPPRSTTCGGRLSPRTFPLILNLSNKFVGQKANHGRFNGPRSFDNIHWRHPVPTKFPQPIIGPGACNYIHCPKVEPTEDWVDEKLRKNIPDNENVDVGINPLPDRHPKGGNAHGIEGMLESLEAKERAEKLSHKDNDERDGFWMWVQGGTLKNKNHGHNDHVKTSGDHFRMKLLDISAEINTSGEEKPKLDILAKLLDEISAEQ
ncbi:unnamed protein product, partial [Mesorhabditis spiculigera]